MIKKFINKVAVVGSGIMGSGIACHFANIGVEVLLLDIAPNKLTPKEEAKGLTLEHPLVKNRIVADNLKTASKSKPAPIYDQEMLSRISVGNLTDDLEKIKDVDWIIEVVIERLDIKKSVFESIEKYRKPGTLISSNTSGIPIQLMTEGRSDDFKKYFAGTHFFNPVRYLPLLEIIPTKDTAKEVVDFYVEYGKKFLGKTTVLCKDTPGFIGNRVGVYSMAKIQQLTQELGLTIEEADYLTGAKIGRPKTGTFKLSDLVGLDTAANVVKGLLGNCKHDKLIQDLSQPAYMDFLLENKFLGNKTKKGFYYKEKTAEGKTLRYALDLDTKEYRELKLPKNDFTSGLKQAAESGIAEALAFGLKGKSKEAVFLRKHFASLFAYVANNIPEISDDIFAIDDAMKTGYAWKVGPFQYWDMLGLEAGIQLIESEGYEVAQWVKDMHTAGEKSFYTVEVGKPKCYDIAQKSQQLIPGQDKFINLDHIRDAHTIWSNAGGNIINLGDGILNLEFTSKMNSLGSEVLQAINKAIDLVEQEYKGLVISNQGDNFSVGANIAMIFMFAVEQEFDELNFAVKYFQDTMMRIRYSNIPVVVAPHNMALGGGCEVSLHADKIVAHSELYMGLVEFGVGVIPGGGGSKEMALRAAETFKKGDVEMNRLQDFFMNVGMAKVSMSAYEAMNLGFLKPDRDIIVVNRNAVLVEAKKQALTLYERGYTAPIKRKDIKVLGKQALGAFYVGVESLVEGKYISEHDAVIAKKLAYVMAGGDLSEATKVDEQYLLDLERKAFLELCMERKTLERIQHMLQKGRPLRN